MSGDAFRLGLVLRAGRRALWRHPVQTLLAVLGVAVGVAVVVAVDLANASAKEAMRLAIDRVAGAATHQIVGSGEGVPQTLYRRLRVDLGLQAAAPVVEGASPWRTAGRCGCSVSIRSPRRRSAAMWT